MNYTNYTKTKNYLTKLRISKNIQYQKILLEVSNNTMNRFEADVNDVVAVLV